MAKFAEFLFSLIHRTAQRDCPKGSSVVCGLSILLALSTQTSGILAAEVVDLACAQATDAQPRVLHRLIRLRERPHHPVGHRPQTGPVLLETFGEPRVLVHPTRSLYLRPAKMEECDDLCAPSAPKCPATLSHLKQIPVRILEPRGVTPGELKDLGWLEVHSARLQRLERYPAILHLDGINRGTQLGAAGCAWPQDELEVLPLDADGQESRSVGCWVVTPLLETDDIRVEVERL